MIITITNHHQQYLYLLVVGSHEQKPTMNHKQEMEGQQKKVDECIEMEEKYHNQDVAESEQDEAQCASGMRQSWRWWNRNRRGVSCEKQKDCSLQPKVWNKDQKEAQEEEKCAQVLGCLLLHEDRHEKV